MTTLIRRSEAKQIMEACEIFGRWPSPYSPLCQEVPLIRLVERFLLYPDCLGMLLTLHAGDEDDFIALQALAECKDYYWQDHEHEQQLVDASFDFLREWVAEAMTMRLLAKVSRQAGLGDLKGG